MKSKPLWIFLSGFVLLTMAYGQNSMKNDNILFEDNFTDESTARWSDMHVWGFGVWRVDNGCFVSRSRDKQEPGLFAALPKVDRAVVRRDFSVRFRYRPVQGTFHRFAVQVRQSGLNHYAFEFESDGSLKITKVRNGKPNLVLGTSRPGVIQFDVWQWIRLNVLGDDPASFMATCWTGDLEDEPSFPQLSGLDRSPLPQANFSLALVSTQQGGAWTSVDDFMVQGRVPGSKQWAWIEKTSGTSPSEAGFWSQIGRSFWSGDRTATHEALENVGRLFPESWVADNNRAVFHADSRQFDAALPLIENAYRAAPSQTAVLENMKTIWQCLLQTAKAPAPLSGQPALVYISTDQNVLVETGVLYLETGVFRVGIHLKDVLIVHGSISDSSGRRIDEFQDEIPANSGGIWRNTRSVDMRSRSDGTYLWRIGLFCGQEMLAEDSCIVEWIGNGFGVVSALVKDLRRRIESVFSSEAADEIKSDWANVFVRLLAVEKRLSVMDQPGLFSHSEENLRCELDAITHAADSVQNHENPFHHRTGQFLRGYFSEADQSVQGYALWVPSSYRSDQPFPLVVNLHGYDPTFSSWDNNIFIPVFMPHATTKDRYILVNPFGRGNTMYQSIGEDDVLRVIDEVRRLYNVDDTRICLTGGSMGGGGTWHIGLSFPDRFAAIAPIMGPTEFEFWAGPPTTHPTPYRRFLVDRLSPLSWAENASGLPVLCNHGALDDIVPVRQSRLMVERFHQLGYPIVYVEHPQAMHGGFEPGMENQIYDWFEDKKADPHPDTLVFKTGDLRRSEAHGIRITRFWDPLRFASIRVEKTLSGHLVCRTDNVARFELTLDEELCIFVKIETITIDEMELNIPLTEGIRSYIFSARIGTDGKIASWEVGDRWKECVLQKTPGLSGPIQDVIRGPFLLVYGTGGSESDRRANLSEAESFSDRWEAWQHVRCPMKPDREITGMDIKNRHLVLFGNERTNSVLSSIEDRLPIRFDKNGIEVGQKRIAGEHLGLAMIYPNPRNLERYVVIFGGVDSEAMDGMVKRIGSDYDFIVFDDRSMGIPWPGGNQTIDNTPLLCGVFDSEWHLSADLQWPGDPELRKKINRHKTWTVPTTQRGKVLPLSDLTPILTKDQINPVERDRSFWGTSMSLKGKTIKKGIGVFPNAEIFYRLDRSWDRFSTWVNADANPFVRIGKSDYRGGSIQFAVYGDGIELAVSEPIDLFSEPRFIDVPVRGIRELRLVVRTQDWLPYFAQAGSWMDAKLEKR